MASVHNPTASGGHDSIIVSQLPYQLLAELKELLLGHFANFGRILRISCTTKGNRERTAHIQFSSSEEAHNAQLNGKIMNGHAIAISITDKHPKTQIIASAPKPLRHTLTAIESKSNIKSTLTSFFQRAPSAAGGGNSSSSSIPTAGSILDEVTRRVPSATNANVSVGGTEIDRKPNTCVKVELYTGQSNSCQSQRSPVPSPADVGASASVRTVLPADVFRPPQRTLKEILNLDLSAMKIIKTPTPSDALACQFFTGGQHPFPLALMFGRKPGSIIMPVKSVLDAIKPGMKIEDSSLHLLANSIINSALKSLLPPIAKKAIQETTVTKLALEKYEEIENHVLIEEIDNAVESELIREEDILICYEEAADALLESVCEDMIRIALWEELTTARTTKAISKLLECCFRKLMDRIIAETVNECLPGVQISYLCEEAVEDILESPIFDRHVRVVANEALEQSRGKRNFLAKIKNASISVSDGKGLTNLTNFIPSFGRSELIENWLENHVSNFHQGFHETDSSHSSIVTDFSRSRSSQFSHDDSSSASSNQPPRLVVVQNSVPSKPRLVESEQGLFQSLKRKTFSTCKSVFSMIPFPAKRTKYE